MNVSEEAKKNSELVFTLGELNDIERKKVCQCLLYTQGLTIGFRHVCFILLKLTAMYLTLNFFLCPWKRQILYCLHLF